MTKINCDVAKDLLPLYVDDVVSDSTRKLVDDHICSCPDCRAYLQMLKTDPPIPEQKAVQDEKAAVQKIRRKIVKKRVLTAIIAAIGAIAIFAGLFYFVCVDKIYVPYEESGLYTDNGVLYIEANGYSTWRFTLSGYPETEFMYMERTRYEQITHDKHDNTDPVLRTPHVFEYPLLPDVIDPEIPEEYKYRIKEIYYVSAETAQKLNSGEYGIIEDGLSQEEISELEKKNLEELKSVSQLIWKLE